MAGIIDGEGHITITGARPCKYVRPGRLNPDKSWRFQINIGVTSTDKRLIDWIVGHFGGTFYADKRQQQNWKPAYRWRLLGRNAQEQFLLGVLPYLVLKQEQANLMLQFIRMGDIEDQEARRFFYEQFMELNRRGVSPETNTLSAPDGAKIESVLMGDHESVITVM